MLIAFLSIIICIMATSWFQQLQLTPIKAQSQAQLTLMINTSQNKYVQLEPVPLNFRLLNQSTIPITWNGIPMLGGRDIDILARTTNGNEVRWSGKRNNIDGVVDTEVMQPEKSKETNNLIDEEIADKLFPQPGRYQVRVEFNYLDLSNGQQQNITIVSNSILIDIDEARGNNRRAYDYLKQIYKPANNGGNITEIIRLQKYFTDNFSNSVYWTYLTYKLANTYLLVGDYEKAEHEFLKISEIDFYYSKQVEKKFELLSRKLGRDRRNPDRLRATPVNAPVAPRPMPVPPIIPVPFPNNPPVRIQIPTPVPNTTP